MLRFIVALIIASIALLMPHDLLAQDEQAAAPYYEILPEPADYGPGNVLARMVDGLGYRYHWASEGLRSEDLDYRPTPEASSALETIQHIYGLCEVVMNTALNQPTVRSADNNTMDYEALRKGALENLKIASEAFRGKTAEELADMKLSFQRGDNVRSNPVWNLINGPLADAIYHTGQLVSFRRTTGNPLNGAVSVFRGKNREQ